MIAGKYRVDAVVGTGGMGVVLSAQHLRLGQSVAIKVLTMNEISEARRHEAQARFLREAQATAGMTSDHCVRVFDVGALDSGVPYMVMELLSGDDLAVVLDREGPLSVGLAIDYVAQACDAIAEAHGRGIAHRDLKPANLFLARKKDGRATIKVLDFGISKAVVGGEEPLDGSLTATRSIVGSPYYMSPEQVRDAKHVDTRTDIWSLGMILYELLIGEPAFDAETLPGICAAIVADPPPPLRMARSDVPIGVEGVIMRCLEKDPAQRFQTVGELLLALYPFLPDSTAGGRASRASAGDFMTTARVPRPSFVDAIPPPVRLETAPGAVTAARSGDAQVAMRMPALWLAVAVALLAVAAYWYLGSRAPSHVAQDATVPTHPTAVSPPVAAPAQVAPVAPAAPAEPAVMPEPAATPEPAADPSRSIARPHSGHRVRSAKTQEPAPTAVPSDIRLER